MARSYLSTDPEVEDIVFLTVDDVARYLRLSRSAVYSLINKQLLPVHRFGGSIRISRQQLDEFIRSASMGAKEIKNG